VLGKNAKVLRACYLYQEGNRPRNSLLLFPKTILSYCHQKNYAQPWFVSQSQTTVVELGNGSHASLNTLASTMPIHCRVVQNNAVPCSRSLFGPDPDLTCLLLSVFFLGVGFRSHGVRLPTRGEHCFKACRRNRDALNAAGGPLRSCWKCRQLHG